MSNPMQPVEVIRTVALTLIAIVLLFIVQPWLYQATGLEPISITDDVEQWLRDHYFRGATIVFAFSIIAQVLWFVLAVRYSGRSEEGGKMLLLWSVLLIVSLLGIIIALFIIETADAFPSLVIFWLIAVGIIFWLATAMNTPRRLQSIIPGSQWLRSIVK